MHANSRRMYWDRSLRAHLFRTYNKVANTQLYSYSGQSIRALLMLRHRGHGQHLHRYLRRWNKWMGMCVRTISWRRNVLCHVIVTSAVLIFAFLAIDIETRILLLSKHNYFSYAFLVQPERQIELHSKIFWLGPKLISG